MYTAGVHPRGAGDAGEAAAVLREGTERNHGRHRQRTPDPRKSAPHHNHRTHVEATLLLSAVSTFYGGRTGRATAQGGEKSTTPRRGTDLGLSFYGSSRKRAPYAAAAAPAPTQHQKNYILSARIKGGPCPGLGGHLLNKTRKEHSSLNQRTAPYRTLNSAFALKSLHRFYKVCVCISQSL